MRNFLYKAGIYIAIFILFIATLILWKGNAYIGSDYARFSSEKQYSLVLGTSMAAQDVNPQILDSCLQGKFMGPLYNYSFSINVSPWGPYYVESILKKLRRNPERTSLFILFVDPFSLGFFLSDSESGRRRERSTLVGKMKCVNGHWGINLEHILRYELQDKFFFKLKRDRGRHIDQQGHFVSMGNEKEDTIGVHIRLYEDVLPDYYQNYIPGYRPSPERMGDLSELIDTLSKYGNIFLVRPPVRKELDNIMDSVWRDFDPVINQFAKERGCRYFNFRDNKKYKTTDGTHLYASEAIRFSRALGDSIKTCLQ